MTSRAQSYTGKMVATTLIFLFSAMAGRKQAKRRVRESIRAVNFFIWNSS